MTEFKTLEELAANLISKKSKSSLLYAFNRSGKTRLSMAVKEKLDGDELDQLQNKEIDENIIFYFNAFTEDLFSWDNDLQNDWDRKLNINLESTFLKYILEDQGKENEIIDLFQYRSKISFESYFFSIFIALFRFSKAISYSPSQILTTPKLLYTVATGI